jgi:hypothetical protein
MPNISPGVYTKIIDLSTYVQAVPSTIGVMCALAEKGEDNTLKFLGSRAELVSEFGQPNINVYGKNYGQGMYCAYNYLGESGSLYFMRCLSDNATFSHIKLVAQPGDSTSEIIIEYENTINTKTEIKSSLAVSGDKKPVCILYPIGRGEYYNSISVKLTEHTNPTLFDVYVMDIYEKQADGDEVIIESFEISFNPLAVDNAGDSLWIEYVLATYSAILRAEMVMSEPDEEVVYSPGYYDVVQIYDKNIGTVLVDETTSTASISDTKQDFTQWQTDPLITPDAQYMVVAIDGRGNKIRGWLGMATPDKTGIDVYSSKDLSVRGWDWMGTASVYFSSDYGVSYYVKRNYANMAEPFQLTADQPPVPLRNGSDGTLKNADGSLNFAEAIQLLTQAYSGTISSPVVVGEIVDTILDIENVYFTMVFDCGYPDAVKTAISTLVQTRRDSVAILDNGDNATYTLAMDRRLNDHTFNTYFVALYEEYNKVYDQFTGGDVWFSPIYHMAYILPRNDTVAELWYAAAGFNRASIDIIKELRFNPKLGQRDQMYLKQLNPIVKFNEGYVVWGQLTSQAKASALQDLNIVRLVLYCKKALERYCRGFIFEMNDAITWNLVAGDIVVFLEDIKRKRGLYSYNVEVGATDYEKKTKTFHVNVTLEPTRVVEKIELNFFIK